MSPQPLASRLEALEDRVTRLDKLPARMDSVELQIVQRRGEMGGEFSAVRTGIRQLREETRQLNEETRQQMHEEDEKTRQQMRELNDGTLRHMLVLYEEVIGRIALLQERSVERRRRKKRKF